VAEDEGFGDAGSVRNLARSGALIAVA
jgi:hypothetical protein